MNTHWLYEQDSNGNGWLRIDCKERGANVLSNAVLSELSEVLDHLEAQPPAQLAIYSGKASGFIAGAEVNEFLTIERPEDAEAHILRVHALLQRLEQLPCPTVALIHGFCLGGGLELALACNRRVATDAPNTRLGFPEVKLGLFPGYGGTVRSVRRCGALTALPLMLSGRSLSAKQAKKMGLVDWVVPERQLMDSPIPLLRNKRLPNRPGLLQRAANLGPLRSQIAKRMHREVSKHADVQHYPAPFALIDHWQRRGGDAEAMYASEAKAVGKLLCGDTARNLIRVFQLQDRLKSLGRTTHFKPTQVHVVGGGIMGGDIAAWCALRGLRVSLQDVAPERLTQAMQRAQALFQRKLHTPRLVSAASDRLMPDHRGYGLARAEVVIEAIFENLDAKQSLFRELEKKTRPEALLASNTSSIPLEDISQALDRPQRMIGLHFFNPVDRMQLVEVVSGRQTEPAYVEQGLAFVHAIDRLPLPVKSAPGFLVNRVLMPYLLEAVELLGEGVPAPVVDWAAKSFGMPVGPLELADSVGLDICLAVARELIGHTATPSEIPPMLTDLVDKKQLGKKSGQGFFTWSDGHPLLPKVNAAYQPPADLTERLIFRLLNEAVACLRENIVADQDLLDAGVIFGTGFAPFRGGPMHYIDSGGMQRMHQRLNALHKAHGEHFHPDDGWRRVGHV